MQSDVNPAVPDYGVQPAGEPVEGAPSDNTSVTAVLRRMGEEGFPADFRPGSAAATLRCGNCDGEAEVATFTDLVEHRLEGASDPDDMVMVVAATCPNCGTGGKVVLGFGPNSSDTDADLVAALPNPG